MYFCIFHYHKNFYITDTTFDQHFLMISSRKGSKKSLNTTKRNYVSSKKRIESSFGTFRVLFVPFVSSWSSSKTVIRDQRKTEQFPRWLPSPRFYMFNHLDPAKLPNVLSPVFVDKYEHAGRQTYVQYPEGDKQMADRDFPLHRGLAMGPCRAFLRLVRVLEPFLVETAVVQPVKDAVYTATERGSWNSVCLRS